MSENKIILGAVIQLTGVLAITIGIICEIILRADIYWLVLTTGAFLFALGTKVKHGGI